MLNPIGNYVLVKLEPLAQESATIATIPRGTPIRYETRDPYSGDKITATMTREAPIGRTATVIRNGVYDFQPGERVLIAMRQAIQVGDDLLVPYGGILARLG